ncbi:hypothetical protein CesoFtcFv8_003430 [Champsocephalus esox]|uniref:Uncharacterized protein n=2 Tax=Champsocephalus TaxID=52236 RepID=A0AAN8E8U4_CHAGU|nr:hypothetical protein CesoFtcFv8_003430 [Champsocephalus esox]KAK5932113.1 hypothetical protein CgunFtcFv8_003845 [Champsocephalus gunnari]
MKGRESVWLASAVSEPGDLLCSALSISTGTAFVSGGEQTERDEHQSTRIKRRPAPAAVCSHSGPELREKKIHHTTHVEP